MHSLAALQGKSIKDFLIDRTLGVNGDEKREAALAELELLLDERIRSAEKSATSKRTVGAIFKDACSKSETRENGRLRTDEGADNDLQAIARYTVKTWGATQARRYGDLLEKHFKALGRKSVQTRVFLKHRPELLVSSCEHHYVFHLVRKNQCPLILAILHENMDLMNRLREHLDF